MVVVIESLGELLLDGNPDPDHVSCLEAGEADAPRSGAWPPSAGPWQRWRRPVELAERLRAEG